MYAIYRQRSGIFIPSERWLLYSFPRDRRIHKRREYLACYEQGTRFYCPRFIVYALATREEPGRFGIAVSRKVGNAVVRNRIKRVLRECYRLCSLDLRGFDIVAVARKNAVDISLGLARAELYPVFAKIITCVSMQ